MKKIANKLLVILLVLAICINFSFAAGTLSTNKMTVAGKERMYLVYLPDGYDSGKTYPLVYMFHGLGSDATFAASDYYGIRQLADQKGFIAVFPDSLKDLPPKDFKLFFYSVKGYDTINGNTARWDIAHIQASDKYNTQDTDFVKGILSTMKTNYKISSDHVYFMGHSYGALFSYYASMSMPDKVTAFAGHSGGLVKYYMYYFPVAPRNAKTNTALAVPGLLIHSTADSVVPYSWDQTLQKKLTANGHPNELVTISLTADGGHVWDKTKNEYIWNWLVAHSSPLPIDPVQPACSANAECGTDGFIGTSACSNGDVYQEYRTYTCNNPGTASAACTSSTTSKLVTDCSAKEVCEINQCKTVTCFANSECGTDGYVNAPVCKNGDVSQEYKTYTCNNPGTSSSACTSAITEKIVTDCSATEVCEVNQCKAVACFTNSECGTDSVISQYCGQNAVLKDTKKYQCLNAGTSSAQCTNSVETTTVQQCTAKQLCENAVCKDVTCFANDECGTDGFIGTSACSNGDVYQEHVTYTCKNPGTTSSSCSASTTNKLVSDCSTNQVCEVNQCKNVACFTNSECGTNGVIGTAFCNDNGVYETYRQYTCANAGTIYSACTNSEQAQLKENCAYGCANGVCNQKPSAWETKYLTLVGSSPAIIWKNKETGAWFVQFDYGNGQPQITLSISKYPGYDVKKVEAEQSATKYWWALWTDAKNNAGLYRQNSSGGSSLIKSTWYGWIGTPKDMGLTNGNPVVLYQLTSGSAVARIYSKTTGNLIANKIIGTGNGNAKNIATDYANDIKVLWEKSGAIEIWTLNPTTLAKQSSLSFAVPTGYAIGEIEVYSGKTFALWIGSGTAQVWKISTDGIVENKFTLSAPGWNVQEMETAADGTIKVLLNDGNGHAQVRTVNANTGEVIGTSEYAA